MARNLILYPPLENSTTHITIQSTPELPEADVGSKIEVVTNNSEIEIETKDKDRTSSDQEFEGSMSSSRTTEESTNTLETKSCNVTLTDLDEADQLQYEDQIQDREDQNQDRDYEQDQEQVWHFKITNFLLNICPALDLIFLVLSCCSHICYKNIIVTSVVEFCGRESTGSRF